MSFEVFDYFDIHGLLQVQIICLDVRLSLYASAGYAQQRLLFSICPVVPMCVPCQHGLVRRVGGSSVSITCCGGSMTATVVFCTVLTLCCLL